MISNPPPAASPSPLRLFMAVDLPGDCQKKIHEFQRELEAMHADVKWVEPRNYHITLKFLGDVPSSRIETVKKILDDCAKNLKAFAVTLDTAGAFPTVNKPDIVWIGTRKEPDNLHRAADDIQTALSKEEFPIDAKPFHTHVTIGRSRSNRKQRELSSAIQKLNVDPIEVHIGHLTLFQSTLSSDGPRYDEVHRSPLK